MVFRFHSILLILGASMAMASATQAKDETKKSALDFKVNNLTGSPVDLSQYKGKVVLIVNTASQCGLTPQYKGLQALHEQYKDQGLAVLGFPANDFGAQEPGTNAEIGEFCSRNYQVSFDLFAKSAVKGAHKTPLYQYLTSKQTNPKFGGEITWNFEKFLIGRDGQVVARFAPKVKPQSPEVVKAIEAELAKKAE